MESEVDRKVVEWADTIVKGPLTELGLLIGDSVRKWRFNNQLRILHGAYEKCKKYGIDIQVISPKLLCPLLDYSSLEDDPEMQDKWANLLTNMLDSKQNIQNHVFPYLLSQLSKNEYEQLHVYFFDRPKRLEEVVKEIESINTELRDKYSHEDFEIQSSQNPQEKELIERKADLEKEINTLMFFNPSEFKGYEYDNLVRLGLIQGLPVSETAVELFGDESTKPMQIMHTGFDYETTQLGDLFMLACEEKLNSEEPLN